jgi:hypothetical protein
MAKTEKTHREWWADGPQWECKGRHSIPVVFRGEMECLEHPEWCIECCACIDEDNYPRGRRGLATS